jgi:hypothetical protein
MSADVLVAQGTISQPRVGRSAALHGPHTSLCLLSNKTTITFSAMPPYADRLERSRGPRECAQPRVNRPFHTMPTRMLRTRRSALCKLASSDCVDVECVDGWEINGMPNMPKTYRSRVCTTHKQPEPKSQVRADDQVPQIGTRNSRVSV